MADKYTQEIREFVDDVKKFILDVDPNIPKEEIDQEFDLDNPDNYHNKVMVAAFRNALYRIDDKIEQDVASELRTVLSLIDKVADPDDTNTKKIKQTLRQLIDESEEDIDYIMINGEEDLEELEDAINT